MANDSSIPPSIPLPTPPGALPDSNATPPSIQAFFSMSIADVMLMTNTDLRTILSQGPAHFDPTDADSPRDLVAKPLHYTQLMIP